MHPRVVTKDPTAVEVEVQAAYLAMFPGGDTFFVPQCFGWAIDCFTGRYADYQPIDTPYHDFEHTLQGTLCFVRLMLGRHKAGGQPVIPRELFQLGLLAALFHDTGYLKKKSDVQGTGAKYTATHVTRSTELAAEFLLQKRFSAADIIAVQNMILCTSLNVRVEAIPFQSENEKIVGMAVGTGDLVGQMAAEDYVDKLPELYAEFAEATRHQKETSGFAGTFTSAEELLQKTPDFWEKYVQSKLNFDFGGLYKYLHQPWPSGRNPHPYLEWIEDNIKRLREKLKIKN